jgi:hypothetical protein
VAEISRGWLDSPDTAVIVRDVRRPADIIGDPQTRRTGRPPATGAGSVLAAVGTLPATPLKESG